jgi:large subunit ribosomal protein L13
MMRTFLPKIEDKDRGWFLIDAQGQILGKIATTAATILTGKRKPIYTPFLDTGDHVVVINAAKVALTGRKETDKLYQRHSGYLSGLKVATAQQIRRKHPTRIVEEAIRGMLPKTRLGRSMFRKLRVYAGDSHPHAAQRPQVVAMQSRRKS